MAITGSTVYLSTFLLEKNRWNGKGPSVLVSDWIEPIGEAGFVGLDLWMNHLRFASRSEWELIRDRAADSDLEIACLSALLPIDNHEKSQRIREAILEACDYFRPQSLKLALGDGEVAIGQSSLDGLAFIKTWSMDVQREIEILFDPGLGKISSEFLEKAREILSGSRFRVALHPFLMAAQELESVLAASGDFIGSLGAQAKSGKDWIMLADKSAEHLKNISIVQAAGFKGTWTLEYTKGVGRPAEDVDVLFDNAEMDFNFLVEAMARNTKTSAKKKA